MKGSAALVIGGCSLVACYGLGDGPWPADASPTGDVGGPSPYPTPTTCTSGKYWTRGNNGSSSMQPGAACIACHSSGEGPRFVVAGTVYPTAQEPKECDGASGATVVVTDAKGNVVTLTTNSAGNFYSRTSMTMPYTAKVVVNGNERMMGTPQTNGDCNSCHSEPATGGAPGRIMLP